MLNAVARGFASMGMSEANVERAGKKEREGVPFASMASRVAIARSAEVGPFASTEIIEVHVGSAEVGPFASMGIYGQSARSAMEGLTANMEGYDTLARNAGQLEQEVEPFAITAKRG